MTSKRQKLLALGASVLVNGGFLFAVAGLSAGHPPVVMEAPVFEVALEDFPVAAQAKASPTTAPSEARPEAAQTAPPPPPPPTPSPISVNKPVPPVETRPAATPTNTPTSDTSARSTPDQAKGTQGTVQAATSMRPSQNTAQATAAPQAAVVGRPTGSYAAQLRRHIESFKVYPRQAKRRRIEGEVTIAFTMDRQGRVLSSRIQKGSGASELDQAALDMLEAAQPLPRPPADVPGDKLTLTYATTFSLED